MTWIELNQNKHRLDPYQRVEVFRGSLGVKFSGWYSVRQQGIVIAKTTHIDLAECKFCIDLDAYKEWSEGHRNVHAWVSGRMQPLPEQLPDVAESVTYRPDMGAFFQTPKGPIWSADYCRFEVSIDETPHPVLHAWNED